MGTGMVTDTAMGTGTGTGMVTAMATDIMTKTTKRKKDFLHACSETKKVKRTKRRNLSHKPNFL